jgi:predicted permease
LVVPVARASAANLLLARTSGRAREIAVRLAIGAGRARIIRQMLTEAFVWTILGSGAGLLLASWGAAALVKTMTTWKVPIVLASEPGWRAAAFVLTLAFLTSAVCAIAPALRATRVDPGSTLKGGAQIEGRARRRWSTANALLVAQVAFTVVLLFGAALFARSIQRILVQDAGVDRESVLAIYTDAAATGHTGAANAAFYGELLTELRSAPGVASASLSWYPPISDEDGAWTATVAIDGARPERNPLKRVYFNAVSPGFFETVGIRLLQGRDFGPVDRAGSPHVAIVNASLAQRLFGGINPIGRRITIGLAPARQNLEIVGLVSDAKYQRLTEEARSIAYVSHAQVPQLLDTENLVAEVRASASLAIAAESARHTIRALDSAVPIRIQTVGDRIAESIVTERVIALLAAAVGIAALVLACAALYGLLAFMVSTRTREIGLRLALGAERGAVVGMVLLQALLLTGIGVITGLAASVALGRFARNLLYQVSPTDALSLAAAALLMLLVGIAAALLPARRASRVDPLIALRSL